MAAHCLSYTALIALFTLFIAPHLSKSDVPLPQFSFGWKDNKNEFITGDIASIKVNVLGNYKSEDYKYPFKPDFAVNDTVGNSSYITQVCYDFGPDTNNWQIHFMPLLGGLLYVRITDEYFRVSDTSMHFHVTPGPEIRLFPTFSFTWPGKCEFRAGDTATIKVKVLGQFKAKEYKYPFNPQITIRDKMGNSSYITGVSSDYGPDTNNWRISFVPIKVGLFHVLLTDEHFKVFDASMHYYVTPGEIYTPGGIVSWLDQDDSFVAGTKATVLILPKDAFGNNVTSTSEGPKAYNFMAYATNEYGLKLNASVLDVSNRGWNEYGYLYIEFIVVTSGSLLVHIKEKNTSLIGSPLPLTVYPGALDVGNCEASWHTETKSFQLFSTMETFITQRDKYGNLVRGLYAFDFEVIEKGTHLSLPIGDLQYEEAYPGILSFTFRLVVPGDFLLIISDKDQKNQILNMPYEFTIYIGYCDGLNSIINGSGITNGSGLNFSAVGVVTKFSILLRDAYQYPSPVDVERLQVKITVPPLTVHVNSHIFPVESVNEMLDFGAFGSTGTDSAPSVYTNLSFWNWKTLSSTFEVAYMPEKSGVYEFRLFCGNIPLNSGYPFRKYIRPAEVNSTVSRVVKYESKALLLRVNNIEVEVMDSFSNHVPSQESKLTLDVFAINKVYKVYPFEFKNGVHIGSYLAMDVGTYDMCISFEGRHISPCPFVVNVFREDYFPTAYNDSVSVWEDGSIAFSAVGNDYFAGGNVRIVEYSMPTHGSLLLYGNLFRYTPYKGFYGNDTFTYSISDVNDNIASASVSVYVLCIPPQFVSFPSQLQANEDLFSPKFGGFPGFEISYSDSLENISITLGAQNGTVFLSPLMMQLWDPMWNELSVNKMKGQSEDLCLVGRLEVINFALQSIQYIGDKNFTGSDAIRVSTSNRNGKNDLDVPIFVNPINDPPFIHVPKFIMLENVTEDEGFLIFNKTRDNFNFSIGDPDNLHFPGNETHFRVMFSVEVSSGFFSAKLPADLISSTELKLKNSKQWQPLQTFVEISRHFTIKAKGIRFRGTINDCNTLLQEMLYYGDEHGGVLRLSVNDLGWYGCYPDCEDMMSAPLTTEATINLISKTPMNSLVAHSLGSVIVIELILLSSLAVILMFFTCKCVIVLLREKKKQQAQSQNFHDEQMSSTDSSENITSPYVQNEQPSTLSDPLHEESGLG